MKTTIKACLTLFLLSVTILANAQNMVAVLDYMKVKPENVGNYLEVEKEWRKIHEARIEAGIILQWELFERVFAGADDPYQYITVALYDDFKKTENPLPTELNIKELSEEELNKLMEKTGGSRTLVRTEVYHFVSGAEGIGHAKYIVFNKMKVKEGQDEAYRKMEDEIFKPIHQESINRGYRNGWSIWSKWPNPENDFQYVAADFYAEYAQWGTGEDVLKQVHPDLSWDEISEMVGKTREIVGSEIWRLVDIIPAPEVTADK